MAVRDEAFFFRVIKGAFLLRRKTLSNSLSAALPGWDKAAIADARASQADILLFGHTHQALQRTLEDGLLLLNPGASRSTFGLIQIQEGRVDCCILPQD